MEDTTRKVYKYKITIKLTIIFKITLSGETVYYIIMLITFAMWTSWPQSLPSWVKDCPRMQEKTASIFCQCCSARNCQHLFVKQPYITALKVNSQSAKGTGVDGTGRAQGASQPHWECGELVRGET